ncbi:TetR/AcrR family transcriptional regulator [Candidatus Thiothrix sp. Deng01]|uniref:TetR/AcrR family transcriptional regulator n=1 Tax=Candidatus Thiothrix phosphatis TaxID=3112415 RepID=A0ABU6D2D3_9GAMM|nr:TetR/AcrR family transcriptional regulator [Candidatus Thiothrix sp. Deng01]MEB4593220.1 TetR/AcrR family transcriptional regulator [Candidatus Thiothrix sp. Deng01]
MLIQLESHPNHGATGRIRRENECRIITAAEAEFARHGYKGASIQKIAERAGLPKANIHYYFRSKLKLYAAVLAHILDMWDGLLGELDPAGDPAAEMEAYIRAKMRLTRQYPLASRIFGIEIMSGAPYLQEYFQDGYQDWFRERTAVFATWIARGEMDPVDPAHLIFLLWSSTQHYADFSCQISSALGRQGNELEQADYEQATETLLHVILKGCGLRKALD